MAKVGLKDTLSLLAKGYSKKEIDALAAVDEENEKVSEIKEEKTEPVSETKEEIEKPDEPDYKTMYEELLKKNKETESTLKKIQKENVNSDSTPAVEETLKKQQDALTDLVRGFM